ncbi:hypothetical protein RvY_09588 [Ramazzottius varieornatus]|uniref:MARVEL domain-containing protein n=1 Tax=Ramazzottius varieornatus TaxID=947166 RepID=A0A1D1V9U7_RAMVA|nr:hypothetical protein RvY_09588 [Ramazzottius varieornatus]
MGVHSCGCCSLKAGCRIGAIWTMIEAIFGIALLIASGLLGHGNIIAIAAACYFVVVFCAAWVLLSGIFREQTGILWGWIVVYTIFLLIRIVFLGFLVSAYAQFNYNKPISFEIVYLSDGTALSQRPLSVEEYLPVLLGTICTIGASIVISAWILVGVVYLAVHIRRNLWKRARLEDDCIQYS